MSATAKQTKHLYSHDVHLREVGVARRLRVTCHSPECCGESVFYSSTMTQNEWIRILNEFYKKHRTFRVKNEGRVRVPE